jgi:hypothetical protein
MLGKTVIRYQYRWFLTEHGRTYCQAQQQADAAWVQMAASEPCLMDVTTYGGRFSAVI